MNPSIERACPVCGSKASSPFLQKEALRLARCRDCSMIYATPVEAELAGDYYNQLAQPFYLSPDKLESDYASVRFERELRLFQKFCRRGTVLDVGCSTGAFLFQLRSRGQFEVTGTDVSKPAAEHARSRALTIIEDSFLEHDFGGKSFDAITFWAVMEHLLEPQKFLAKATELLRSGGVCFILVPNMNSLAVRLAGKKYRYIFPQHVNYFTAATLRQFATSTGLTVVAHGSTHFNPIVIWQDLRSDGRFVPDQERASLLKRTTAYKENTLLTPAKWLYRATEKLLGSVNLADNLYIVLRKK